MPGGVLIVGGVVTGVAIDPVGPLNFFWLPFFLGVTFLLASLASGSRARPLWATGVITTIFGIEAELTRAGGAVTGVPVAPGEILALGIGLLVVAFMARFGFPTDPLGAAVTVASTGVLYYGADKNWASGLFVKPLFYGGLVVVYGLFELRPRAS